MDLGALFLILALALLAAAFIARPFLFRRQAADDSQNGSTVDAHRSELLAERDRLLSAIQELEFDHSMGKIPDEDYTAQRNLLRTAAAGVLRSLDGLAVSGAEGAEQPASTEPLEPNLLVPVEDELEELVQAHRRNRRGKAGGFCPKCGKAVLKSDKFCSTCGTFL